MSNYNYGWQVKLRKYSVVPVSKYTKNQRDMYSYVTDILNKAIKEANCGWVGVHYEVLSFNDYDTREYMILYNDGDFNNGYNSSRWIPIDGNSKGCNFSVLGENLW